MSDLTDDRLDTKALAERALSNAAVASQHHIIDQGHEQADEVLCEALILNIEQAINLALRAAASTSTEGAGVKGLEEIHKVIDDYVQALLRREHGGLEADHVLVAICKILDRSPIQEYDAARRNPPAPKVTT